MDVMMAVGSSGNSVGRKPMPNGAEEAALEGKAEAGACAADVRMLRLVSRVGSG